MRSRTRGERRKEASRTGRRWLDVTNFAEGREGKKERKRVSWGRRLEKWLPVNLEKLNRAREHTSPSAWNPKDKKSLLENETGIRIWPVYMFDTWLIFRRDVIGIVVYVGILHIQNLYFSEITVFRRTNRLYLSFGVFLKKKKSYYKGWKNYNLLSLASRMNHPSLSSSLSHHLSVTRRPAKITFAMFP